MWSRRTSRQTSARSCSSSGLASRPSTRRCRPTSPSSRCFYPSHHHQGATTWSWFDPSHEHRHVVWSLSTRDSPCTTPPTRGGSPAPPPLTVAPLHRTSPSTEQFIAKAEAVAAAAVAAEAAEEANWEVRAACGQRGHLVGAGHHPLIRPSASEGVVPSTLTDSLRLTAPYRCARRSGARRPRRR